jgi:CRP-like cAMP-binding protein
VQVPLRSSPPVYIGGANSEETAVRNRILLSIPGPEFHALRPFLQQIRFAAHRVVYEPGGKLQFAYFPNGGLISLIAMASDGRSIETGLVGREGVVGLASAVGFARSPLRQVAQITSDGFRIAIEPLKNVLRSAPRLQMLLSHHAVLQCLQASQVIACNRFHNAAQRLARWLLMAQDRVDSGLLRVTHDFLATMLGTDRPTVSLAASQLRKKGCIQYVRGGVRILNRERLESAACECYRVLQQWYGESARNRASQFDSLQTTP